MSYLDILQDVSVEKWLNTRLEEITDQQLKQYFYCFTLIRLRISDFSTPAAYSYSSIGKMVAKIN